jgi:hypothetical protein
MQADADVLQERQRMADEWRAWAESRKAYVEAEAAFAKVRRARAAPRRGPSVRDSGTRLAPVPPDTPSSRGATQTRTPCPFRL